MPVQAVELVGHHHVNVALGLFNCPEVAAAVKMHSAVSEAGLVKDLYAGENPGSLLGLLVAVNCGRKHLLDGFAGIDEAVKGRCLHLYIVVFNLYVVLLRAEVRVELEVEAVAIGFTFYAGSGFKGIDKPADSLAGSLVNGGVYLYGCTLYAYRTFQEGYVVGLGDYGEGLRLFATGGKHCQACED